MHTAPSIYIRYNRMLPPAIVAKLVEDTTTIIANMLNQESGLSLTSSDIDLQTEPSTECEAFVQAASLSMKLPIAMHMANTGKTLSRATSAIRAIIWNLAGEYPVIQSHMSCYSSE